MPELRLSVLDQSTAAQGRSQDHAIRETLELARHCDALGYHRYWVSEHHNSDSIVGTVEQVATRLAELAARLELDELVVVTWTCDPQPRHRSYELLARAFRLDPAPGTGAAG